MADDMHRVQPRVDALGEYAQFLSSDNMLQKRSKIPYTVVLSAIKLFTSVDVSEGPAHPVEKQCYELLYARKKLNTLCV